VSDRTLVIGWFSFELMGETAGDRIARDVLLGWLRNRGIHADVAMHRPQRDGEIATDLIDPRDYDTLIFVCGPIGDGPPLNEFLARFPHARMFALNVSLLQERSDWDPFERIVERDSSEETNPDMTFAAGPSSVPVIGMILVGAQGEYPSNRHDLAEKAFQELLHGRDIAVIPIDTRLDVNEHGLTTAAQVESVISRMDAVLTTRLHGAAIALRRHVPAVVIDSVPGGTKVLAQMRKIGWPLAFDVAELDQRKLAEALEFALTPAAKELAAERAAAAREDLASVERRFLDALQGVRAGPRRR